MATRSIDSLRRSWAHSDRRSKSPVPRPAPPTLPATDMQQADPPGSPPSSPRRAPSPGLQRRSPQRSSSPRMRSASPGRQPRSPVTNTATDPNTQCLGTVSSCDARCTVLVGGHVWVGERDGAITVRRIDGDPVHIIERRKGAFVWSMVEVGEHVWAGCSDGFIRVLSASTYKMDRQFARHAGGGGGINAMAYHKPSRTVFSGSNDFEILSWRADTCDFLRQFPLQSGVRCLLADTHVLYSGSDDGVVTVWDVKSGQKKDEWRGHSKGVHSLCLTDNHVWSGSEDTTIRIWEPNGQCIGEAEVHTGAVSVLVHIGTKVWSGAGDTLCLWDAERLKLLGTYVEHDGYLSSIQPVAKAATYKVWTTATDRVAKAWQTEVIPDETDTLKRRIEQLQHFEYENGCLKDELATRDRRIADLEAELAASGHELDRRKGVDAENQRLRDDLAMRAEDIRRLNDRVAQLEQDNRSLCDQVASLKDTVASLSDTNARLESDLARSRSEAADLREKLRHTIETYDAEVARLQADLRRSQSENDRLTDNNARLRLEKDDLSAQLSEARRTIDTLNAQLRDTVDTYEARIRELGQSIADLEAQNEDLRSKVRSITIERDDLARRLAEAQEHIASLSAELEDTRRRYDGKIDELNSIIADLQGQNDSLRKELENAHAANARLQDELQAARNQIDQMSAKLREMDTIFKSRLSLITEIFRVYKRFEGCDKRMRGIAVATTEVREVRDQTSGAMGEFKAVIANHFTDDELAHLGSSRHFFPVSVPEGSPSKPHHGGSPTRTGAAPHHRRSPTH